MAINIAKDSFGLENLIAVIIKELGYASYKKKEFLQTLANRVYFLKVYINQVGSIVEM